MILVDGEESDIENIQVDDIHSFSVLKDASATQIYGEKGKNGVVLITTKKAHEEKAGASSNTSATKSDSKVENDKEGVFWIRKLEVPGGLDGGKVLVIIDGEEETDIESIPTAEIESISVLKDASATQIYGEKGKHGVILITTKKGKKETKPTSQVKVITRKKIAIDGKKDMEAISAFQFNSEDFDIREFPKGSWDNLQIDTAALASLMQKIPPLANLPELSNRDEFEKQWHDLKIDTSALDSLNQITISLFTNNAKMREEMESFFNDLYPSKSWKDSLILRGNTQDKLQTGSDLNERIKSMLEEAQKEMD